VGGAAMRCDGFVLVATEGAHGGGEADNAVEGMVPAAAICV